MYVCVCTRIQDHDQFVLQLLNGIGDFIDLKNALNPHLRPDFHRMSLQQMKQYVAANGHCSVLVKVLSYTCINHSAEAELCDQCH